MSIPSNSTTYTLARNGNTLSFEVLPDDGIHRAAMVRLKYSSKDEMYLHVCPTGSEEYPVILMRDFSTNVFIDTARRVWSTLVHEAWILK